MLCGECMHSGKGDCDYDSDLDYCRFCPPDSKTSPGCHIVVHRNYAEGSDAYESGRRAEKNTDMKRR